MTWQEELKAQVPRAEIPGFLADLQALVAALREHRPWEPRLTMTLRQHPALVLGYMTPGPARDKVEAALRG